MDSHTVHDGAHSDFLQIGERTEKSAQFGYFSLRLRQLGGG